MNRTKRRLTCWILLTTLFACLLLPLSVVRATAEAAGSAPQITIAHHNLLFEDQVYLLYAVQRSNAGDTAPVMQFWKTEPTGEALDKPDYTATPIDYRTIAENDATKYYIFVYTHLAAKNMSDVIYARAGVTVNGTTVYSELDHYSICEYAARKLGVVSDATPTTDESLKALLRAMLDYGTQAQLYFNYRTDILANRHYLTFQTQTPSTGLLYQTKADGTLEVTGYEGEDTRVVIGVTGTNGALVTSIGANAFANKKNITEVVLPLSVTEIGASAFAGCPKLQTVVLPDSVTKLGEKAFSGCKKLTLSVPATIQVIGSYALPLWGDDCTVVFRGTAQQLRQILNNNPNWSPNGDVIMVSFPDGSNGKYPE